MYGYLRLDTKSAPVEIRRYYRQEYCTLCHSLWNFYGIKPRFLLSYDVTLMAVLLDLNPQITFYERLPICYFKQKIDVDIEKWKRLSAISVLLATEKLRDNIYDENSMISRIFISIFHRSEKRAKKDYPKLSSYLRKGFRKMNTIEKKNGTVNDLASEFANILVGSKILLYGKSEFEDAVLRHVAEWIYFIDAIDDLDKDVKEGSYNPFLQIASSRDDLIVNHFDYVSEFIINQRKRLVPHIGHLDMGTQRGMVIINILNYSIPMVTRKILLGEKAFSHDNPYVKYIEGKGGIVFA